MYRVIPKDMTRGYDVYCEMTADSAWLVGQISLATSTTFTCIGRPSATGYVYNGLFTNVVNKTF